VVLRSNDLYLFLPIPLTPIAAKPDPCIEITKLECEIEAKNSEMARLQHKVASLMEFKDAAIKDDYAQKYFLSHRENQQLRDANYKLTSQSTRDQQHLQQLKDELFETSAGAKEHSENITQLNKFLKETKDMLDSKSMAVFELEKQIKSMGLEFRKLENFSKGSGFGNRFCRYGKGKSGIS